MDNSYEIGKRDALKFINSAKEPKSLIRHFMNSDGEIDHYIIGGTNAEKLMVLKEELGGELESLDQLEKLENFGENKIELLIKSFTPEYLKSLEGNNDDEVIVSPPNPFILQRQIAESKVNRGIAAAFTQIKMVYPNCSKMMLRVIDSSIMSVTSRVVYANSPAVVLKFAQDGIPDFYELNATFCDDNNRFLMSANLNFHLG